MSEKDTSSSEGSGSKTNDSTTEQSRRSVLASVVAGSGAMLGTPTVNVVSAESNERMPVVAKGKRQYVYEYTPETISFKEYYISNDLARRYGRGRIPFDEFEYDRDTGVDPELNKKLPETGRDVRTFPLNKRVGTEAEWNRYYQEKGKPGGSDDTISITAKSDYSGPRWQYKKALLSSKYTITAPINAVWESRDRSFSDIVNKMTKWRWKQNDIVGDVECSSARFIWDGYFRTGDDNLGTDSFCIDKRDHIRMWKDRNGTFGGPKGRFKIGSAHRDPFGHVLCPFDQNPIKLEPAERRLKDEWSTKTSADVSSIDLNNNRTYDGCVESNDDKNAYIRWKPP